MSDGNMMVQNTAMMNDESMSAQPFLFEQQAAPDSKSSPIYGGYPVTVGGSQPI